MAPAKVSQLHLMTEQTQALVEGYAATAGALVPMSATWGEFQSLIQLSIALNGAFAAFSTFFGADIGRYRAKIDHLLDNDDLIIGHQLSSVTPSMVDQSIDAEKARLQGRADLIRLKGRCAESEITFRSMIHRFFRYICVVACISGISLIVYSSFYFDATISNFWRWISVLHLAPFLLATLYAVVMSLRFYVEVAREFRAIEERIEVLGGQQRASQIRHEGRVE